MTECLLVQIFLSRLWVTNKYLTNRKSSDTIFSNKFIIKYLLNLNYNTILYFLLNTIDCRDKFEKYVLVQSIIITLLGIPIIFIIRNQPPTPPSSSAEKVLKTKSKGQLHAIKRLIKNRDYIFLMLSFSFIYSIYTTLGSCVGQISSEFGFQSSANSLFGSVYIVGGLIGSFSHAILLDKYHAYKKQYLVIGFWCILALAITTAVNGIGNIVISAISLAFLGVSQLPIIGVAYAFSSELTYPISEAMSWGFLQLFGSIVASIFTFAEGYMLSNHYKYLACFVLIGSVIVGTIFQLFVRENLLRSKSGIRGRSFSLYIGNTEAEILDEDESTETINDIFESTLPVNQESGTKERLLK